MVSVVVCSVVVRSMVVAMGVVGGGLVVREGGGMWLVWVGASVILAIFCIGEVLLLSD